MICKQSLTIIVLICLSSGLDDDSDGQKLTSNSHGLSFESMMTSNPYISKHTLDALLSRFMLLYTVDSVDNTVLMTKSYIHLTIF